MSIPQTPSPLSNILAAKTYNAAWFSGATKELQITAAIAAAVTDGALYVYVPANMLPYNASAVTFNTSISMIREGGNPAVEDIQAYGATAALTTATAVDCTAAIVAALATGRNVEMGRGVFGFTGGLNVNTPSQQFKGAGKCDTTLATGTILHKLSGTGRCVLAGQTDVVVSDFVINCNGLAGSALEVYEAHYSQFQRLALLNQGGTNFALKLYSAGVVNLCTFEDIFCGGSSTRFLKCENVLYSVFTNISCGACEINIGEGVVPGSQAQALKFYGLYTDGPINIHDGATGIYFYGLTSEAYLAGPVLNISGSTTQGIHVYGFRYYRNTAGATPLVTVVDAKNVRLSGIHWQVAEGAGQHLIEANNAQGLTVDGADVTNGATAFVLLKCVTALSGQITVRDVVVHGGGVGSMLIWASKPLVENVELDISFVAGQQRGAFIRVSGAIDATNAVGITIIDQGGGLTDPNKSVPLRTSTAGTEVIIPQWGEATVTYSASMTPNAAKGRRQIITATNGTAFTINAPSNPLVGMSMTITLRNTSGGALGASTWNAVFKMAAWVNPGSGQSRSITFTYDGSNWVEESRTPADVPN